MRAALFPRSVLTAALALLSVFAAAGSAVAQSMPSSEQLFLIPPPGWVLAYHDRQGNVDLTELVPPGQTAREWTEMLTVQMITGKPESSPQEVLKNQLGEVQKACEDVGAGPVGAAVENGYDTALRAIACTKSKQWGKGELNLYKVIRGRERLYVVARAWRGAPFAKDKLPIGPDVTKQWLAFMQQVRVCDSRDAQHPCPNTAPPRSSMH